MEMSIAKIVTDVLKDIGRSFNEVSVDFDKKGIWHDQYAMFIAEFDLFGAHFYTDNPYTEVIYDTTRLIADFRKVLEENLPAGSTIEYWSGTGEWEICGPNYKKYYKQIQKKLEMAYGKVNGHAIFEEIKWTN